MAGAPNANSYEYVVKGVAVPGTAEQVEANYVLDGNEVNITARRVNTGSMYLGFSQTEAQTASTRKVLIPGQSTGLKIDNTDKIWVDADNANDRLEISVPKRP